MKESLPINYDILKWARTSLGLPIAQVAHKMKQSEQMILDWEIGAQSPTYSQLEKLAYQIYKRPVAVFFFPTIPLENTPVTDFRTLPSVAIENLPIEIIKLYRKARVFQLNLNELYEGNKPTSESLIDSFAPLSGERDFDFKVIAASIREQIRITIEEQLSWQSYDLAFKKWRKALEENGIFIFKDGFQNDDYSGFCIYDSNYPIIYINNSMPLSRQIFTIFHELAHLLLHTGGIDFRNKNFPQAFDRFYKNIELKCNQFANEFLVPYNYFNAMNLEVSENQIEQLARNFSVSRQVILRNYLDRNLLDEKYYHQLTDKWADEAPSRPNKSKGGHYYYTQKSYLGDPYISLAFAKYYQNKISLENLAGYLNMKVKNVLTFENYTFT